MLWEILWKNKNALSLGFCLSFSLISILLEQNIFSQNVSYLWRITDNITSYINSGVYYTDNIWVELDEYRSLKERYNKAKKMLESYKLGQDKLDFLYHQNKYLRAELKIRPLSIYPEIKAEVLSVRLSPISPRIIIGKGKKDGCKALMPVIASTHDKQNNIIRGMVGIIIFAEERTSIVQPFTHPNFEIGVRIDESQEWAILSGNSGRFNEVLLTYITSDFGSDKAVFTQSESALKKGVKILTSGAGGVFPSGIPIGLISGTGVRKNGFKTAYIKPFVKISELNYVSVIRKEVANWKKTKKQKDELRWEDYLQTEFGETVFPKLSKKDKIKKIKQKKNKSKTTNIPSPKKNIDTTKEKQTTPRIIQNLSQ